MYLRDRAGKQIWLPAMVKIHLRNPGGGTYLQEDFDDISSDEEVVLADLRRR